MWESWFWVDEEKGKGERVSGMYGERKVGGWRILMCILRGIEERIIGIWVKRSEGESRVRREIVERERKKWLRLL